MAGSLGRRTEEEPCPSAPRPGRPGPRAGSTWGHLTCLARRPSTASCWAGPAAAADRTAATASAARRAGRRRAGAADGALAAAPLDDLLRHRRRRPHRERGDEGRRHRGRRPDGRRTHGPDGDRAGPAGPAVRALAVGAQHRRPALRRARRADLERAGEPRSGGRAPVLRGGVRVPVRRGGGRRGLHDVHHRGPAARRDRRRVRGRDARLGDLLLGGGHRRRGAPGAGARRGPARAAHGHPVRPLRGARRPVGRAVLRLAATSPGSV